MLSNKHRQAIEQYITSAESLPALPNTIQQVNDIFESPDFSLEQIEDVIKLDPVLAATVLKVVNSSFYGLTEEVSSIRLALVILGLNEIKKLIYSLSVIRIFPIKTGETDFDYERFWMHAAITGRLAESIATRCRFPHGSYAFLAGLLHDLGQMVFLEYIDEDYSKIYKNAREEQTESWKIEEEAYGFHHGHVGGWLAEKWNLPEALQSVLIHHVMPQDSERHQALVGVIGLIDNMLRIWEDSGKSMDFDEIRHHESIQAMIDDIPDLQENPCSMLDEDLPTQMKIALEFVNLSKQSLN
jgi:HD-like signal output (HDOD) protein